MRLLVVESLKISTVDGLTMAKICSEHKCKVIKTREREGCRLQRLNLEKDLILKLKRSNNKCILLSQISGHIY